MGETVRIQVPSGEMAAYVARPATAPAPAVVVLQEIFGVNAVMREITDGLASQGFLAICPDLFWRIEPGVDISDRTEAEWKKAFALMNAFDAGQGVTDIAATLAHIRADPGCTGKAGAVTSLHVMTYGGRPLRRVTSPSSSTPAHAAALNEPSNGRDTRACSASGSGGAPRGPDITTAGLA